MSTISSLATYTKVTANKNARVQKVCKITPHYMADNGAFSGKGCADYFYTCGQSGSRQASSNYCIGGTGDIACSVPEEYRAWTSSSEWNDQRAITIEVSCTNNTTGEITAAAWNALVNLCVDICKRYGFTLNYTGDSSGSLTEHRMYASTACPGAYLHGKMAQLAKEVNAKLSGTASSATSTTTIKEVYWNYDATLVVGDCVSSCPCKIAEYNGTGNCIVDDCVNVPYLGGLIPLADVTEAKGTKDGACDQILSNEYSLRKQG